MGLNLNLNINGAKRGLATPPVPTDVVITVVSDTAFSIAYVSAFPVEFWYSTTQFGVYTKHGDSASTPYAMTGLTAGTKYYVEARAVNGSKFSEFTSAANATTTLSAPTAFTSVFTVDTITGTLAWTDNSGGLATYEVYSNTNGAGDVLLTTTAAGATSYGDTTCKQNATVVYKIRAKKGSVYSEYATATALVTPLCWKTDQKVRTNVVINTLNIAAGKTVNIDWGDGTNADYTGNNASITKTYGASAINVFNISLSGDINFITRLYIYTQPLIYGNISNYILPSEIGQINIDTSPLTGDVSNIIVPNKCTIIGFLVGAASGLLTGKLPNLQSGGGSNGLNYNFQGNKLSGTNLTIFRVAMTHLMIKNQTVVFPTSEIDKLLKAAADWYQLNAPTANCTFDMSGANMGIPTGGASNVDLVRLAGYYTDQSLTATIVVRTS